MKDLTEALSNKIVNAINVFRLRQEETEEALCEALRVLGETVTAAHSEYELAAGLRVEGAKAAMASQIMTFLGVSAESIAEAAGEGEGEAPGSLPQGKSFMEIMTNVKHPNVG